VRGAGLGDVLLCVPIIRYIKQYVNPKANIDWLCGTGEFVPLLNGCKWVRTIYDDKNLPPDVSHNYNFIIPIDYAEFKTNDSFTMHRIDVFARRIKDLKGVTITDKHLEYQVTQQEEDWLKKYNMPHPYVVMVTKTTCFNRVLTHKMNCDIAAALIKLGYTVVMLDKDHIDNLHPNALNFTTKTDVRRAGVIIKNADAVITPDTGLFHIASALDKPTLAYFGAMNPKLRVTSSNTRVLYKPIQCWPCNTYVCHQGRPLCVQDLSVDDFINAFKALMGLK
jgi:ADP-heptose:LPS heptosyltransferase